METITKRKLLEDVFKTGGLPTYTFVKPVEYASLLIALRTPGRGVVVEGPSGIGKTTAVTQILNELGISDSVMSLSARKRDDVAQIKAILSGADLGTVIIDDFHKLDDATTQEIADFMKVIADEERQDAKIVILGINRAGESLVRFAHDLNNRIEVVKFEANPPEKIEELLRLGEDALNITINVKSDVIEASNGGFYIAQVLAHEVCINAEIFEEQADRTEVNTSFELIRGKVFERLARTFRQRAERFARGTRFRREGRAPYLHLLHWLGISDDWSLSIDKAIREHPQHRGSIGQIADKGYLNDLISGDEEIAAVLHYDERARLLTVEDPQFIYFARNIFWAKFASEIGFLGINFPSRYDIALSFAGTDRAVAEGLNQSLQEMEFEVFYDRNEQHRILAEDVEDYLRPIYQSDAQYVVVLLGPDFPKRIWTKFESEQFRERFGTGAVIPIWFKNAPPGMFDESTRVGGLEYDPESDLNDQISHFADTLRKKIGESRE
ncbi:ATPase family protein associated with various cellular activities (AAA) [Rubidibacter lacunae KORDI 51-2]|uniref:ATPase family protein associated with various cellular activities (AAA) n=1 Tax=Rubidibacter lacunae KORDI 51-2 TaxID=582515 RepID=U5DPJ3_9CHRO|nr:TIR domain-containing protein [Rubidibacter lacunae]ERN41595.1 ATPase family protein associated with various cellular activities (AAA) [Rubidibacter lacunae KORDI 51-2]